MRRNRDKYCILYILLDCKKHTISEIAEKAEISYPTAQRHIAELSSIYPIEITAGGRGSGGVQLIQSYKLFQNFFSKNELQFVIEGLKLLQDYGQDTTELIRKIGGPLEANLTSHADTPAISSVRSNKNGRVM